MAKDIVSYFLEKGEPLLPKPKPRYTESLKVLETPAAKKMFYPESLQYMKDTLQQKAYQNKEITTSDYYEMIKPQSTEPKLADGRIEFKDGGDYWSMVTRMFVEAGSEKGTGMNINDFAAMYFPRDQKSDGGRIGFADGPVPIQKQPAVIKALKIFEEKVAESKKLLEEGFSKADVTKKINEKYGGTRNPKSGPARYTTEAARQLEEEGFVIKHGNVKEDPQGKTIAKKKRQIVTKESYPTEKRFITEKTEFGKKYEIKDFGKKIHNAHTANIFQAKALNMEYPLDALAPQTSVQNLKYAEKLNEELKPLYKEQLKLKRLYEKNPSKNLINLIEKNNLQISELVSSGGSQGSKASNLLRGILYDPINKKGVLPELGFNTLQSVDRGMTGTTMKSLKAKTPEDVLARANYRELLKQKFGKVIKPITKVGGKVIKPLGIAAGISAAQKASAQNPDLSLLDLFAAYETQDPAIGLKSYEMRQDPRYGQKTLAGLETLPEVKEFGYPDD